MQATRAVQQRLALSTGGGRRVRRLLPQAPPSTRRRRRNRNAAAHAHAGSHTSLALLEEGYEVVIYDDLSNSFLECFERLKELAGPTAAHRLSFVQVCALLAAFLVSGLVPWRLTIPALASQLLPYCCHRHRHRRPPLPR